MGDINCKGTIDLDNTTKIQVTMFKGNIGVDIRKFWLDLNSGAYNPGKGIRISMDEWKELCLSFPKIDGFSAGATCNVSEDVVVSNVEGGGVDIRRFYKDRATGEMLPTKKGVRLTRTNWDSLQSARSRVDALVLENAPNKESAPKRSTKPSADSCRQGPPDLSEHIDAILKGTSLSSLTMRKVRSELETALSLPPDALAERAAEIKSLVSEKIQQMEVSQS